MIVKHETSFGSMFLPYIPYQGTGLSVPLPLFASLFAIDSRSLFVDFVKAATSFKRLLIFDCKDITLLSCSFSMVFILPRNSVSAVKFLAFNSVI